MNFTRRPYAAFVVSSDVVFTEQLETTILKQFQIRTYRFGEKDLRNILRISKPLVILWDGRQPSAQSRHFLHWLREHFPGCPILALLNDEQSDSDLEYHKLGINLLLDTSSTSFFENLCNHIGAIIRDCELVGYSSMSTK